MLRIGSAFLVLSICWSCLSAYAQDHPANSNPMQAIKVVVGPPNQSSDSVIAVPPETSVTVRVRSLGDKQSLGSQASADAVVWANERSSANGLQSQDLQPWHIVITYDQFDDDGDNIHSGTFEEFWAGAKKYKTSYQSDNLNQTNYVTGQGLFRAGDQRWPSRAEILVQTEVVDPFAYATTLKGFHTRGQERAFGAHSLDCVLLEREQGSVSSPSQYCFAHNSPVLRYSRGFGWLQTTYNNIESFQGRYVARDVAVTDGGHPFLNLHVKTLETISPVNEKDFAPPTDAVNLRGKIISGVFPRVLHTSFPKWPSSLRGQHIVVTVDIVIGKDGRVESAHAVSGPSVAYKAAEKTAKQWIFQPYLVAGEPTKVETKIEMTQN